MMCLVKCYVQAWVIINKMHGHLSHSNQGLWTIEGFEIQDILRSLELVLKEV